MKRTGHDRGSTVQGVACLLGLLVAIPLGPAGDLAGQQVPPVPDGQFRIATWNIRFFPEPSTDVERTAGIIASLDADLIAVQEITDAEALSDMLNRVNRLLAARTGEREPRHYAYVLGASGGHGGLTVGYLYDRNSVSLSGVETLTSLQMTPDLRPALLARVTSLQGGLDFQVIVTHTDSGTRLRDYAHRMEFLDSLSVELGSRWGEEGDFVVLGDLNTMGHDQEGDRRRVSGEEELAILDRKVEEMGLTRVPASPACTEYYQGAGSFLDHILIASPMREVPTDPVARVFGYCAEVACRPVDPESMPYDYVHVSDHCPVVIDVIDVDWD